MSQVHHQELINHREKFARPGFSAQNFSRQINNGHLLQRGGSRVGGFPDLNGLPWEAAVWAGFPT
ncbi:MAG: hypothetical protein KME40_29850 [Komarekiella atlantica HA4396-MV6]|nr:hypothetical protein [Komarekiella atlantica HA4396-MV6]